MSEPRIEPPHLEWTLRAFALLAYGYAVQNLARAWFADRSRASLLLLLVSEGFTLALVLFARPARRRDVRWSTLLLNVYAAFSYVLFDPQATQRLVSEMSGVVLQTLGVVWQFAAKCALGRSFGVLPALRGVAAKGPYRVVRHPIYLGYLVAHVAFLLVNFSWRNTLVLGALYIVQCLRMHREESILAAHSAAYRDYQASVPWRLIPGLY